MRIHLRTLGALDLRDPQGREVQSVLVQPKRVALLTYLAIAAPRGFHRRDSLLALFWAEQDAEHARAALRQALHALRRSLGESVVVTRGDDVRLDPEHVACDIWSFEQAVERGAAEEAVSLYGGDFLAGFFLSGAPEFEHWVEGERRRLARTYAAVLERVAEVTSARNPVQAVAWWRRLAEHDPYSSRVALRLMEGLATAGNRAAAIRHAEHHATLLREDLDAEPDPEVRALADRLRRGPTLALSGDAAPTENVTRGERASAPVAPAIRAETRTTRPAHRARVVSLALALLVAGTAAGWWLADRSGNPRPLRVAVLPFANMSGDPRNEYLADGLTETVIAHLGNVDMLRVIARTSVMPYKDTEKGVQKIADELGVALVLEGSVHVEGDRMRVVAQLIEAASDEHLYSHTYEGQAADLFAIQSAVARDIVQTLRLSLSREVDARIARPPTASLQAYELYLKGRYHFNDWNRGDIDSAIAALERAVAEDPDFAVARAALANAYLEKADLFEPRRDLKEKAYIATETALSLDAALAEGYVARGNLLWTAANRFPHEAAIREFRRAVVLRPSLSSAHDRLAMVYMHVGLLDQALEEARQAVALDPLDLWARFRVGHVLATQRRYREAAEELERLPDHVVPFLRGSLLAEALLYLGRPEQAAAMLDELVERFPDDPLVRATRAMARASLRDSVGAESDIGVAAERAPGFAHGHHAEYAVGSAYALLGRDEMAVEWLRRAAQDGFPCFPRYAGDHTLNGVRSHPEFVALLRDLETEWERYRRDFGP